MQTRLILLFLVLTTTLSHAQSFLTKFSTLLPIALQSAEGEWVDLDQDSLLDAVLVGIDSTQRLHIVAMRNEWVTFTFQDISSTGLTTGTYALMDYDHNGLEDMLVSGTLPSGAGATFVLLNDGNFQFHLVETPILNAGARVLQAADLDHDGQPELIMTGTQDSKLSVYQRSPSGYNLAYDSSGLQIESMLTFDFLQNGKQHVALSGKALSGHAFTGWLENKDHFTFQFHPLIDSVSGILKAGDFNQDGWMDLALNKADEYPAGTILFKNVGGSFQPGLWQDSIRVEDLLIADFNSNGNADASFQGRLSDQRRINIIYHDDTTTSSIDTSRVSLQRFGDFDRDGDLDVFQLADSVLNHQVFRFSENTTTEINQRPGVPTSPFAISTYTHTFIYWERASDDLTPTVALTYDLWLKRDGGTNIESPDFTLENNLHRFRVSHGHQGAVTSAVIDALTDDKYSYYIQAVDNAFNGSAACTGGVLPCFDLKHEEVQACLHEVLKIKMPEPAIWFSTSSGFLSVSDTLQFIADEEDTIYAFIPQNFDCAKNRAWAIHVHDGPQSASDTIFFCEERPLTLGIDPGWQHIEWRSDTIIALDTDSITLSSPHPGTIMATAYSADSCQYTKTFVLRKSAPAIAIGEDHYRIISGQSVTLAASGIGDISWSPPQGLSITTGPGPVASPMQSTTYTATLTDSVGCIATAQVLVEVTETAFLPNLFTPNGDGNNDTIQIYGLTAGHDFEFLIYNREGNTVYQTSDIATATTQGWDGNKNGVSQLQGLYYWKIRGTDSNGNPLLLNGKKTGSILLVR